MNTYILFFMMIFLIILTIFCIYLLLRLSTNRYYMGIKQDTTINKKKEPSYSDVVYLDETHEDTLERKIREAEEHINFLKEDIW